MRFETDKLTTPATCPQCGARRYVTRRSPHPKLPGGETQILTCHQCGAETTRSVYADGKVAA